jgi:hypothetical protein
MLSSKTDKIRFSRPIGEGFSELGFSKGRCHWPLLLALPFYTPNRDGMSESGRALIWDLLGSIGELLDFIEPSWTLCLSARVDSEHS